MTTILEDCVKAMATVEKFCQDIKSGETDLDAEDLSISFLHIYYCGGVECGELWSKLNENETDPSIRKWIENWTSNPDAMNIGMYPASLKGKIRRRQ